MIRYPFQTGGKWTHPNSSDKSGAIAYSRNIDLGEEGYVKLSPRTVRLYGDSDNSDFGLPFAIGRQNSQSFQIGTHSDANFTIDVSEVQKTFTENSGSNEPTFTVNSHACWFAGLWHGSTATAVLSRAGGSSGSAAWTSRITGLTPGKEHILEAFASRNELCVTNGNVVKQYDTSYANTTDLTIPSDFEATSLAYNNSRMAVGTRLNNDGTYGQNSEARLFVWNGTTNGAQSDAGVGSDAILFVHAYLSSFVLLNRAGELLYWNGGGFTRLAAFPFYFTEHIWNSAENTNILGRVFCEVDGDVIYINLGLRMNDFGRKAEEALSANPSGVWCYDPKVGLYHKMSPSISPAYVNYVASSGINTATDTLTISAGVYGLQSIPATGGVARLTNTDGIGGLELNHDYYIIKVSTTEFKLATTRENALAGTAIDITSATTGDNFFWMYDLVDFGQALFDSPGAVSQVAGTSAILEDLIFGARLGTSSALATNDAVCAGVPFLENRGFIVTPKLFSGAISDVNKDLVLKFRALQSGDSIVVKYRTKDVVGFPTATNATLKGTWTSPSELYSSQDFSEAKAFVDGGGELEMEILSGAGGGTMVQVVSMGHDSSTGIYSFVLEEDVLGASAGLVCEFSVDHWKVLTTITSSTSTADLGYISHPIGGSSRFIQFKFEMRGSGVVIEEWGLIGERDKIKD